MHRLLCSVLAFVLCPLLVAQQAPTPTNPASPSPQPAAQAPNSAGAPAAPVAAPSGPPPPHTLLDGTPVKLRLSQTISSSDAKVGQEIPFEVVEDVKVEDVVVIPKGASAIATVTEAQPKRRMGRGGKLNVNISYARLTDQEKVGLRASKDTNGGGHIGAMTGAMVATAIVFFPAAPLFLFMHGKDVTIPQGTEITAFVDGDMHLDMAKFSAAPAPGVAAPAEPTEASLTIDSSPAGADIYVDGSFVGNAPSTIKVAPGSREITVKKKGFADWTRQLNVTGGSVHLSAELDASPAPATTPAPN